MRALVLLVSFWGFSLAAQSVGFIPNLPAAPKVDGELGKDEWGGALAVSCFAEKNKSLSPNEYGPLGSQAWIGKTASALYVAFSCRHDRRDMAFSTVAEDDGPVYSDDCVEVFLDTKGKRQDYYHVIANVNGAVYDAHNEPLTGPRLDWSSGTKAAGKRLKDGFVIEMAIPLSSLALGENEGGMINLNLCREIRYLHSAQGCFGDYHAPLTWQTFQMEGMGKDKYPVALDAVKWSDLPGRNEAEFTLRNLSGKPLALKAVYVLRQGDKQERQNLDVALGVGQTRGFKVAATVVGAVPAQQRLAVLDAGGKEILSAGRKFTPRQIAAITLDSDVLLQGEKPCLGVKLNIPDSEKTDNYALGIMVQDCDKRELLRLGFDKIPRDGFQEALDISAVARGKRDILLKCELKSSGEVLQEKVFPVRLLASPWCE